MADELSKEQSCRHAARSQWQARPAGSAATSSTCSRPRPRRRADVARARASTSITGEGLAEALAGVDRIVDAATGRRPTSRRPRSSSPTAARNLQEAGRAGRRAADRRGVDHRHRPVLAAATARRSVAHEQAMLAGPDPGRRCCAPRSSTSSCGQLMDWGTPGRRELRAAACARSWSRARTVAEALADLATGPRPGDLGRRSRRSPARARRASSRRRRLLAARRGGPVRVEAVSDPSRSRQLTLYESGALLPGPDAIARRPDVRAVARRRLTPLSARAARRAARMQGIVEVGRPPGAPVLPDRAPGGGWSGPLPPGDGRAADLCARPDRSRSAYALMTIDASAVRVLGRGGGTGRPWGRPGRVCLAQRGELERCFHGAPHQLAERALGRATGDRRGEHAFVKLRSRSDGNGLLQGFLQGLRASPHHAAADRKLVRERPR